MNLHGLSSHEKVFKNPKNRLNQTDFKKSWHDKMMIRQLVRRKPNRTCERKLAIRDPLLMSNYTEPHRVACLLPAQVVAIIWKSFQSWRSFIHLDVLGALCDCAAFLL